MLHITYILYMAWGWHGLVTMQQAEHVSVCTAQTWFLFLQRHTNDTSRNKKHKGLTALVTFLY